MATNLEQTIKDRLARIGKTGTGLSKKKNCAASSPCSMCVGHRGVRLFAQGSVVSAGLCQCIKSCELCEGSCLRPVNIEPVDSADVRGGLQESPSREYSVKPCVNISPKRIAGIFNDARIPSRYLDADLSKFDGFNPSDRTQKMTIANWMKALKPGQSSGLLLSGPVGIGKSWLLAAMAKHLAMQGFSVRYADFFQLIHELRDAYASDQGDKSSLKPLQNVDVLIIDELGKGRNTEWELSVADSLISDRYNGNKCIIAATNYPLRTQGPENQQRQIDYLRAETPTNQMNTATFEPLAQRIGSRMFSRLAENCICMEVSGHDRRRR